MSFSSIEMKLVVICVVINVPEASFQTKQLPSPLWAAFASMLYKLLSMWAISFCIPPLTSHSLLAPWRLLLISKVWIQFQRSSWTNWSVVFVISQGAAALSLQFWLALAQGGMRHSKKTANRVVQFPSKRSIQFIFYSAACLIWFSLNCFSRLRQAPPLFSICMHPILYLIINKSEKNHPHIRSACCLLCATSLI